jgi:dipeptide/tripeptide permease
VDATAPSPSAGPGRQRAVAVGSVVLVIGVLLLVASDRVTPMSYVVIGAAVLFWAGAAYVTEVILRSRLTGS